MSDRRFFVVALGLSAAAAVALMGYLRAQDAILAPPGEAAASPSVGVPKREIPAIARVLRAMKLVTVEIETGVTSQSDHQSWRGDVHAAVSAPARLYYGVDLSRLTHDDLSRNPLTGTLTLRVPPPERIAVEVYSSDEHTRVKVGGLRLRDVAGEYHLGLARAALDARARAMTLSADDQARLRAITREQLGALVRALADEPAAVNVEFLPPAETRHAGGAADTPAGRP